MWEPVLPPPALAVRQPRKFAKICADRHWPRAVNVSGRLSRQSMVTVRILRLTVKKYLPVTDGQLATAIWLTISKNHKNLSWLIASQKAQAYARFKEGIYNIAGMVLMMHLQMSNYACIIVSVVQLILNGDDMHAQQLHWMLFKMILINTTQSVWLLILL